MIHGLLWFPLLACFMGLAWAGWNEYQKLEAYRVWAEPFDHAKYDIYAVLGQKDSEITWGKPTRKAPLNVQDFSLQQVQAIEVKAGDRIIDPENPPAKARQVTLVFQLANTNCPSIEQPVPEIQIPFTELSLALRWAKHLKHDWQRIQAGSNTELPV
ncbi:MAG: hypothetical protein HC772_02925 [Leptolyngbyaceae cyanobacterium CRU_2_3]|nr:hypothetical protein [Leptolyngbyaceae cyanobacterium CRU_2_3]